MLQNTDTHGAVGTPHSPPPLPLCSPRPAFDLDPADLEARYKALQRRLHPDGFSTAPPTEREFSAEQASAVNQAYDTLRRPLRRAAYMVGCVGVGEGQRRRFLSE